MMNPFKPLIDRIPKPLRNKYFLALGLFVVWMLFFDRHHLFTQLQLHNTLESLKEEKTFYEGQIKQSWQDRLEMEQNREKFAREKYHLKKKNEDVYVIIEE